MNKLYLNEYLDSHPSIEEENVSLDNNKVFHDSQQANYDSGIYVMDAHLKGNVSRFYNHSCSPNVFVQNVFIETWNVRFPWVAFFTTTNVKAGTELVWDYSYEVKFSISIFFKNNI
jgi:SET domain-containing protein